MSEIPGEVGGFGLLDAPDIRDLVAAASRNPRTRWCVTALNLVWCTPSGRTYVTTPTVHPI